MVVEDAGILNVAASLGQRRVANWPKYPEDPPVWMRSRGNADKALDKAFLGAMYQIPGLRALGVVVDAEAAFAARWNAIRTFAADRFENVPAVCPAGGLILRTEGKPSFGAWIMPDCNSNGMVEDFCRTLVPDARKPLWNFAESSIAEARANHGADYRDAHTPKARMHSYLAWSDPPGERVGTAIAKSILDPNAASAQPFLDWMKSLYSLQERVAAA